MHVRRLFLCQRTPDLLNSLKKKFHCVILKRDGCTFLISGEHTDRLDTHIVVKKKTKNIGKVNLCIK